MHPRGLIPLLVLLTTTGLAVTPQQALRAARAAADTLPGSRVIGVLPTGSMRPTFDERALLVVTPAPFGDLRAGDVVVFRTSTGNVAHRIAWRAPRYLVTKGDANHYQDPARVLPEQVLGRVSSVHHFQP